MCVIQLAQCRAHNWHLRGGRSSLSLSSSPSPPSPPPPCLLRQERGSDIPSTAQKEILKLYYTFILCVPFLFQLNCIYNLIWHIKCFGKYWDIVHKIIVVLKTWVVQIMGSLKCPYQAKRCLLSMCTTCSSYCETQQPQGPIIIFRLWSYFLDWFDPTFEVHRGFQCLSRFTKWLLLCSLFSKCLA